MGSYFKKTDFDLFYVVRETPRSDKFFFIIRWEYFVLFDKNLVILEFLCLDNFQRSDLGPKTMDKRIGPWFRTLVMQREFRNRAEGSFW